LGDIMHRGRQRHQRHVLGTVDDDLLPDRPPPLVTHVVALVQDHGVEPREPARVEHVAEDLRGHDEHGSARIDLDVARQDPDLLRPRLAAEVRVLLVGERLERRGVGDAPAAVYLTRREPHRTAHLERLTALWARGLCIGGGPAPDGLSADIFYRVEQPGDVTRLIEEDAYFTGGAWTAYRTRSFAQFLEP